MRKEESAVRGQKIRTETGPDRSSHKTDMNEAIMGRKMGGGPTDLSHSLSGGATTVNHMGKAPKSRK